MYIVETITIIIAIIVIYNFMIYDNEVSNVKSNLDGFDYIVLNLPDKTHAADKLAELRKKLNNFVKDISSKSDVSFERLRHKFKAVLSESKPGGKFTSYTVNKGSNIHMCIRERDDNNKIIEDNTLFFVALHELAHCMTVSIGHTKEFWSNFKILLKHAIDKGYYVYKPYHQNPEKYCGTYITDTPLKL